MKEGMGTGTGMEGCWAGVGSGSGGWSGDRGVGWDWGSTGRGVSVVRREGRLGSSF